MEPPYPEITEKAEISIVGLGELYRELRIESTLTNGKGTR
jgi:hypothetical protein